MRASGIVPENYNMAVDCSSIFNSIVAAAKTDPLLPPPSEQKQNMLGTVELGACCQQACLLEGLVG